ncbi:MAG: exonuclease subunit SbcD, partial [Fibrobacterota bacterium]
MKILHTSDWHLGQNFLNRSRRHEHAHFLDRLIAVLYEEKPDALIVAGDIFDTGTPPSYARQLYHSFLDRAADAPCPAVIIIGGNHDSPSTLNESRSILRRISVHVIGGAEEDPAREVFTIRDQSNTPRGIIAAVPFLRDRDVRRGVPGQSREERSRATREGITAHYEAALQEVQKLKEEIGDVPAVATGHLTTAGGSVTEGVRELYIGSLENYGTGDFPDSFEYIALGHLHKKQSLGNRKHIRYCGSPIPLSFEESRMEHS